MAIERVTITEVLTNQKAVRAMRKVIDVLEDIKEDFDYREDVKQAVKAARYVVRHMGIEVKQE